MAAQSNFSHNKLMNKNTNEMQEMLFQEGINWNNYDEGFKQGRMIVKVPYKRFIDDKHIKSGKNENIKWSKDDGYYIQSSKWEILSSIDFLKDKETLLPYINNALVNFII